jgi:decaprenylphospho-beta-D-erythro-pentofuranosid-2-ulose 2-reductase
VPKSVKRIVVIGATSAIAEHCLRLWVTDQAVDATLVGRDIEKTERVATDLRVRSPQSRFHVLTTDFFDPETISTFVQTLAQSGAIDIALIAHGSLPDQKACQSDLREISNALLVNGISPLLFAEAFAMQMEKASHGTLAIIGSVAGDRGRKSNYVYGSAKGMVARYAQGLQHRFAASNMKVVLVKPGPTDTPMTAHLKHKEVKLAAVENVAALIAKGIELRKSVVYAPNRWQLIMMVVRHLPRFIFEKMDI